MIPNIMLGSRNVGHDIGNYLGVCTSFLLFDSLTVGHEARGITETRESNSKLGSVQHSLPSGKIADQPHLGQAAWRSLPNASVDRAWGCSAFTLLTNPKP